MFALDEESSELLIVSDSDKDLNREGMWSMILPQPLRADYGSVSELPHRDYVVLIFTERGVSSGDQLFIKSLWEYCVAVLNV